MKTKLWLFFLVLSGALATLLVIREQKGKHQKNLIEQLQLQVERTSGTEREAQRELASIKNENRSLREKLTVADVELNRARLAYKAALELTNSYQAPRAPSPVREKTGRGGNPMSAVAEMMKDPEMRKAMAQQQKMMLDTMYGSLFKQLQLTPEQTDKFKDLLVEQQMSSMNSGLTFMDQTNTTERAELGKKMAEEQKQKEAQIQEFLGDEKFQQYKDYMGTMAERMVLDQFAKQTALKPEQMDQLLAAMKEEKENVQINQPISTDFGGNADFQKLAGSDEFIQKQMEQQEQINQNVLERARQILTPEQYTKFESQLKSQLAMQQLGLKMARKMMNPDAGESPNPAPTTASGK
jgi:hypothetical protein